MAKNELQTWLASDVVKNKFNELLGKNAPGFMSALANIYSGNKALQNCDARSIIGAAALSASMRLSITPTLGQAYIVPMKGQATFQIGVHGMIQLAHRTKQYVALHAGKVCEGELRGFNPITGEPIVGEKISDEVVGYVAYMRLINGFEKTLFMTTAEIEAHAEKYSQSYRTDKSKGWQSSPWTTNFDAMASKTVLKKLLNAWGVLSADMATAIQADQSVVDRETFTYNDNGNGVSRRAELNVPPPETNVDMTTGELYETLAAETSDDTSRTWLR